MTFVGSLLIMLAFAAAIFVFGLMGVHLSLPPISRRGLWSTFWSAVVLGDRARLAQAENAPAIWPTVNTAMGAIELATQQMNDP